MRFGSVYTEPFSPENPSRDGKASAALRAKFTILNLTMQISLQNSNRIQINAVSLFTRQMKPHRLKKTLHFRQPFQIDTVSISLDLCRVNRITKESVFV